MSGGGVVEGEGWLGVLLGGRGIRGISRRVWELGGWSDKQAEDCKMPAQISIPLFPILSTWVVVSATR